MPIFKYNGDKTNMNGCFGYDFSNHLPVNVPDSDKLAIKKFTNNSHFDLVSEDIDDPDINCDYGVFRVQGNGQNYSKPDKVCDKKEDAEEFIAGIDDGKTRIILRRTKA